MRHCMCCVMTPHWRETSAPDWDCRARAQTVNRVVAVSGDRCRPRGRAAETDGGLTTRRWRSPEGDPRAGASARRLDGFTEVNTEFEKGRSLPGFTYKVLVLGASHRHG